MNPHGSFVWYELITPDVDGAQGFYADVIGWSVAPGGMPGIDYRIAAAPDGDAIAGLMQSPPEYDGPTMWRAYLEVGDVDAEVEAIVAAGGELAMPPMDVPGVGRMAMVADPHGTTFYVMTSTGEESRAFLTQDRASPGHAVWNDLAAPDPDTAIAFYTGRFGWRQEGAMPMGELGDYRFLQHDGDTIGAVMPVVLGMTPGWRTFFTVPDVDRAVERIGAGGGPVVQGPDQIPGGDWSVVAADPQGAQFGLVGRRGGAGR